MVNLKQIFIATRPWSFPMTIISISLGVVLAYYLNNVFRADLYLITLIGSVMLHAAANVINDYFDSLFGVDKPEAPTARYRPHPIIEGFMRPNDLMLMAIGLIISSLLIGLYLMFVSGPWALILGAIGALLAITYSGPPFNYKYKALGELIVFIVWGPIMVLGAYYVQTSVISQPVIIASTPIGLLVSAVLLANNIRDIEYDVSTGIRTIPIILGRGKSIYLYDLMIIMPFIIVPLLIVGGILGWLTLITVMALPKAIKLIKTFRREVPDTADPMTAQLVMIYGILYIVGIFLSGAL